MDSGRKGRKMASLQWMNDALCAEIGVDPFFPESHENHQQAVQICRRCPVQTECLEHALKLEQSDAWNVLGIWGGLTPRQRRSLLRDRRARVA